VTEEIITQFKICD